MFRRNCAYRRRLLAKARGKYRGDARSGSQDLARSRTGLLEVATACNRCHLTFRVAQRVRPFADLLDNGKDRP